MPSASINAPAFERPNERVPSGTILLATTSSTSALSFAHVYDQYARFAWRALIRLGVAEADVEDLTQEVFLVVHRRLGDFREQSTVRTWVYGIAVHVARNYRRTRIRRHDEAGRVDVTSERESLAQPAGAAPDALFEKAQAAKLLIRLLDELDQTSREVFVLAELEEMTASDIGEILELNPNTVASRLRNARRSFDGSVRRHRARDQWRVR